MDWSKEKHRGRKREILGRLKALTHWQELARKYPFAIISLRLKEAQIYQLQLNKALLIGNMVQTMVQTCDRPLPKAESPWRSPIPRAAEPNSPVHSTVHGTALPLWQTINCSQD